MLTKIMRHGFISGLFLVVLALLLLWPSPPSYKIQVGFAVCVGAMLGFQAGRAGKHAAEAGHATVPYKVKFEN